MSIELLETEMAAIGMPKLKKAIKNSGKFVNAGKLALVGALVSAGVTATVNVKNNEKVTKDMSVPAAVALAGFGTAVGASKYRDKKTIELSNAQKNVAAAKISGMILNNGTKLTFNDKGELESEAFSDNKLELKKLPDGTLRTCFGNEILSETLPDGTQWTYREDGKSVIYTDGTAKAWKNGKLIYKRLPDGTKITRNEKNGLLTITLPDGTSKSENLPVDITKEFDN